MASTSNHGSPKRLVELLGEEQDPFMLESYLLERGCRPKSLELQRSEQIGVTINTNKLLKRSATYHGSNRSSSSKSSGKFSKFARSLCRRFISNHVLRLKHSRLLETRKHDLTCRINDNEGQKEGTELSRFSNDSLITVGNTFSESEMDTESITSPSNDANCEITQGGVMTQWRPVEENKQHSPVSVLDTIEIVQTIPVYNGYGNETVREEEKLSPSASKNRVQKKVSDDMILSASMWELLISSQRNKTKESSKELLLLPQLINSKKSLQQTRQLLFDCVREVVENQTKNQRQNPRKKQISLMTGPEEIGKIICNKLKTWGDMKLSTNMKQVVRMDLVSSFEEEQWSDFQVYKKAIAFEIGDGLFDQIQDEIVSDLVGHCRFE